MIAADSFCKELQRQGVGLFSGVPDSLLEHFCAYVEAALPPHQRVINANEGGAVAAVAGFHLATGQLGLVYMQNSGLGNALNPLVSLADREVYSIPMILLIGWRGEPGIPDEPQHVKQGRTTLPLLEVLEIPYRVLGDNPDDSLVAVSWACATARDLNQPVALVARKGVFSSPSGGTAITAGDLSDLPLTREAAIGVILDVVAPNTAIVCSTGKASRELYELRRARAEPTNRDFLTVGSMGHACQIALGLAMGQPTRQVICLDGDGAVLMHMGCLAIAGQHASSGFRHVVLNNAAHESVGGQSTVAGAVDLSSVAAACGYLVSGPASNQRELVEALRGFDGAEGPVFLEVRVRLGSRTDLGRPKEPPRDNKEAFMEWLRQ